MTTNLPTTTTQTPPATPVPQQFSRAQQVDFVETLSHWGNVSAAARAVGVSRATAYRMRRACPNFARLWDAALLISRPQVEAVLADRALNGVEEKVFYHGEEVATAALRCAVAAGASRAARSAARQSRRARNGAILRQGDGDAAWQ